MKIIVCVVALASILLSAPARAADTPIATSYEDLLAQLNTSGATADDIVKCQVSVLINDRHVIATEKIKPALPAEKTLITR